MKKLFLVCALAFSAFATTFAKEVVVCEIETSCGVTATISVDDEQTVFVDMDDLIAIAVALEDAFCQN